MIKGAFGFARTHWRRLTNWPAYLLLLARRGRFPVQSSERFGWAWLGMMILAPMIGLMLIAVWGVTWGVFRDYGVLIRPAAVTAMFFLVLPMQSAMLAVAEAVGGKGPTGRVAVTIVLTILFTSCFMCLRPDMYRSEFELPAFLQWIRPATKIYRVLLMMPIWGVWAMLISLQFARPTERSEPAVQALAKGCGPLVAVGSMLVPLAGNIVYFHYLGTGAQVTVPLVTILAAIVVPSLLAKHTQVVNRGLLLAGCLLTQLVFLITVLCFE